MKTARWIWAFAATVCLVIWGVGHLSESPQSAMASIPVFGNTVLKQGAQGADVAELQGRLKYLGYYAGEIDSSYGPQTIKSVKWFQSEFALTVDGVAGEQTKNKLQQVTQAWKPQSPSDNGGGGMKAASTASSKTPAALSPMGLSDNDLKLMANAVYGESRGEPFIGQVAVAAVILNRVKASQFPNTVSGVIFEPRAFTAVADGQINLTPNENARKAVMEALGGQDPTGGALYYFNPSTATSKWIWTRKQIKTIGKHIFCL